MIVCDEHHATRRWFIAQEKQPRCDSARKATQRYRRMQLIILSTDLRSDLAPSCWSQWWLTAYTGKKRRLRMLRGRIQLQTDEYWWMVHSARPVAWSTQNREWGPFCAWFAEWCQVLTWLVALNTSRCDNAGCSGQSCSNNRAGFDSIQRCRTHGGWDVNIWDVEHQNGNTCTCRGD